MSRENLKGDLREWLIRGRWKRGAKKFVLALEDPARALWGYGGGMNEGQSGGRQVESCLGAMCCRTVPWL